MNKLTFAHEWEQIYNGLPDDMDVELKEQVKLVFYAGASTFVSLMRRLSLDSTIMDAMKNAAALEDELEQFAEQQGVYRKSSTTLN